VEMINRNKLLSDEWSLAHRLCEVGGGGEGVTITFIMQLCNMSHTYVGSD
jgi:hypothetical protein